MRILLVDNSDDYRSTLAEFLGRENYEVVEVGSVEQAIERLESKTVTLAVIDLRLVDDNDSYDVSGFEVAKKARELVIPRIIITVQPTMEMAWEALRSVEGEPIAYDFVDKSAGPRAILVSIEEVLSIHGFD